MTTFTLRIYGAGDVFRDEQPGYPLDGAEVDAAWYVNHDGAAYVHIVRDADGEIVRTVTPAVTR